MSELTQQLYALAQQLHRQGRFAEAEQHYRKVIAVFGEYAGALTRLAEVCFRQEHYEDAAGFYRRAVAATPRDAAAQGGLGCTLNQLRRPQEALPHIRTALALAPNNAGLYLDLGNAQAALNNPEAALAAYLQGAAVDPACSEARTAAGHILVRLSRLAEAASQYQLVLARQPDHLPSLGSLGALALLLGNLDQAIACFETLIRLQPENLPAHYSLGHALQSANRHEEAVDCCRRLVALAPDQIAAHNMLGRSLSAIGRSEDAAAAFETSLALDPGNAATHFEIGNGLQLGGHFAEARSAIARAIAAAPNVPTYWYSLVQGETIRAGDPAILALEKLAQDPGTHSEVERIALYFALAKVYDDLGRHEASFACLKQGNAVQRALTPYDEAAETGMLRRIAALFSAEYHAAHQGYGDPSDVPIFVVGMPRSGTTLIEQILASHNAIFGAGEAPDLANIFDALMAGKRHPDTADLKEIGSRYVEKLRRKAPAAQRISNKMPGNFASVGLIALALPKARIIHVRRDPLDTCFSCYSKLFDRGHLYTYDLAELGRYYLAYEELMAHWRRALPPGAMLEITYEELIGNFEVEARRIVEYCGLEWDEACFSFHKKDRPVATASVFQVRQPLYRSAIGRAAPYRAWLGPLCEALGNKTGA